MIKGIPIHECYILLDKVAPSIAELTSLAAALGKDVENIEFEIFDAQAYTVNKRYKEILARNGKDSEISKSDWVIWDVHYLALSKQYHEEKLFLILVISTQNRKCAN